MRSSAAGVAAPSAEVAMAPVGLTLEVLSSIAHELRTPLSALTASAEMLGVADGEDARTFAGIIQRQALRLNSIVDGLLEAYRASHDQMRDVRDLVDMEALLQELCAEQQNLYPQHMFAIDAQARRQLTADRRILGMVVGNLLSNAAKYSPPGSTVYVECNSAETPMRIRVRDEGTGVPAFVRRRVFRAGDRGIAVDDAGCGLGLFIARQLCDAIGADISLEDSGGEGGACFVVTLPN